MIASYPDWCDAHGCSHGHCPLDCEHPQPFVHEGRLYCGRCWVLCKVLTEMVPCGPNNCGEEGHA